VRKYENENNDEDDDGMLEMERNQEGTELRIVEMLEEEEPAEHPITDPPSSNLPQILKLEPKPSETPKDIPETYSSDDDFMFRPVPNKRKQKKQKFKAPDSEEIFPRCQSDSSAADSESERLSELENHQLSNSKGKESKDGWSFEIDEEDVNKLLDGEEENDQNPNEERTDLEDVFRFDSEMQEESQENRSKTAAVDGVGGKAVSVEDLNDALIDDTEDSEVEGEMNLRQRKERSEGELETGKCNDTSEGKPSLGSLSSSCAETTDASESSVTNSPNVRATNKSKSKKGKKKKR